MHKKIISIIVRPEGIHVDSLPLQLVHQSYQTQVTLLQLAHSRQQPALAVLGVRRYLPGIGYQTVKDFTQAQFPRIWPLFDDLLLETPDLYFHRAMQFLNGGLPATLFWVFGVSGLHFLGFLSQFHQFFEYGVFGWMSARLGFVHQSLLDEPQQ